MMGTKKLCNICPRRCNVDRSKQVGFCKMGSEMVVAHYMLHHYEEPIISGECECDMRGSGAIFFSGCNLACCYCQNYQISSCGAGKVCSVERLIEIIKELEAAGAYNINFVTPTHFADKIIEALSLYKPKVPVVWNTGGYETPEQIEKLRGYVDIFLTDLKYFSPEAGMLSGAPDYFEFASKSLLKMREICPQDVIEDGIMKRGIIVRHLVLPGLTADSVNVLKFIAENLGKDTIVSILSQYEPFYLATKNPKINRRITPLEYKRVVNMALSLGLNNAYVQELCSSNSKYVPVFDPSKI